MVLLKKCSCQWWKMNCTRVIHNSCWQECQATNAAEPIHWLPKPHYELRQGQEALFDVPILSSILFAKLIRYNFTAIKHIDSELVIFGFKNFKTWTCLVFCALLLYAAVAKIWMPILYIQLVGRSWSHMLRINLRKCGLNIILMWKSVINLHWSSTNTLEVSNTTNFSGQYL